MLQTAIPSPWTVREADFPVNAPPSELARHLLRYAILAPSTKNTQPWTFHVAGSTVHVLPDFARWQRVADPDQRELHISLGCALENLIVAADHFGYDCTVAYGPPEAGPRAAVASVTITPARAGTPHMRPAGLFAGLTSRLAVREPFTARGVPAAIRRQLEHLPVDDGVSLLLTDDPATLRGLDRLNTEADVAEVGDADYRRELAHWVGQGIFGTSWIVSKLGRILLPHLDNGRRVARRNSARLDHAPLIGLIATASDDRTAQVRAGQVFERLFLMATLLGLSVQPMSQALEIPTLRSRVPKLFPGALPFAQQPFRIGYAIDGRRRRHTPRRRVEEVLAS